MPPFIHELVGKIIERLGNAEAQEKFLKKSIPAVIQGLRQYFRLKTEGLESIPETGAGIIVANHSGVTALDAVLLAFEVAERTGRIPRIIAHRLWFAQSRIAFLVRSMGFVEASKEQTGDLLKKGELVILFPEGEAGNFKPSSKAYHLREFKRGFVRLAIHHKAPVIPVAIVGAEEANINLTEITALRPYLGITIPLPLNILPLPSKWHIKILPPLKWSVDPEFQLAPDSPRVRVLAQQTRRRILHELKIMLRQRGSAFV